MDRTVKRLNPPDRDVAQDNAGIGAIREILHFNRKGRVVRVFQI